MRIGKTFCHVLAAASAVLLYACAAYADDGGFRGEASFSVEEMSRLAVETGEDAARPDRPEYEPQVEEVHITVPGMEKTRTLVWVSDLHLCSGADDPDVTQEHRAEADERYEMMKDASGLAGEEIWKDLSARIDTFGADGVVFGADMLDYFSEENLEKLQEGLEKVGTPWMYLRADHDYGRWYLDMDIKKMRMLHRRVAPQNRLWVMRFEDFTVAGLDNTTTAISDETLEEFRLLCEEGLPIILCTHVPFDSGQADSPSLAELSQKLWERRVLCWGDGDYYDTSGGGNMKQLLEIITSGDSPVLAVLAGHLHASWDGALTENCTQHVFDAAVNDAVGLITVSG